MNTNCEKCIFKVMDNDHKQQIDCGIGVTSKILEYSNVYGASNISNNNGYFRISNFYCPFGKTQEWRSKAIEMGIGEDSLESVTIASSQQKYHIVLLIDNNNIEQSLNNLLCLKRFSSLIHRLSIIYISDTDNDIKYIRSFCTETMLGTNIVWRLSHIQDTESTISEAIDAGLETFFSNETSIITILDSKNDINDTLIANISDIINFHLHKPVITMSSINEFHCLSIPVSLYDAFYKKIGLVLDYIKNTSDNIISYYLA